MRPLRRPHQVVVVAPKDRSEVSGAGARTRRGGGLREIDADRSLPKTLEQGRQPSAELGDRRRRHENSRSARAICSKRSERAICVRHEPSVAPAAAMDSPSGRKLPGTMGSKGWMRCWRGRVGRHGARATNVAPASSSREQRAGPGRSPCAWAGCEREKVAGRKGAAAGEGGPAAEPAALCHVAAAAKLRDQLPVRPRRARCESPCHCRRDLRSPSRSARTVRACWGAVARPSRGDRCRVARPPGPSGPASG